MRGTSARLTTLLNESLFPLGLRLLQGAMLLEIPPRYVQLLGDMAESHPDARCVCGSDKVLNYGIPQNNGRYFLCRRCATAFKAPVFQREWNELYQGCGSENSAYDFCLGKYEDLLDF